MEYQFNALKIERILSLTDDFELREKIVNAVWKVDRTLTSISVYTAPTKTVYYVGDSLSTSGLKLKLTYSDGSTEYVTSGFTTSGFSSTTAGTKQITVTYSGKTTSFSVTVKTPSVSLSSTSQSIKVGETATLTATTDPSGQNVSWKSSDTSVATVSNGVITAKAAGTATVTAEFTYNGTKYSRTCSVTVVPAPVTMTSISIASLPKKTVYQVGEAFDASGLVLRLNYSDGTSETIASGFTVSGFDSAAAGTKTVTVSYQGMKTSINVEVKARPVTDASIEVSNETSRVGDTVSMAVTVDHNPGINTFALDFQYDTSKLRLDKVEINPDLGGQFSFAKKAVWLASSDTTFNGKILTLTFTVLEGAELGVTPVSVSYSSGDFSNLAEEDVEFNIMTGSVNVIKYIAGDINDDGAVNNKDLTRLLRVLAGEPLIHVEAALDVNGDGSRNNKDLTRLMKYLAGDAVEIH